MAATAKVEFNVPVQIARLCRGITVVNITKPPANIPDAPTPAIARPAMRQGDEGANALTRLPTSNKARELKYTIFFGNSVKTFPASG